MLTALRLKNFKNFADETLRMGPFTIIVGANASGKSNIRDALRFLHGVGRGYTLAEILGGKYGAGGHVEWEQIRGAPKEVVRRDQEQFALEVDLTLDESHIHLRAGLGLSEDQSTIDYGYAILVKPNARQDGAFLVGREALQARPPEPGSFPKQEIQSSDSELIREQFKKFLRERSRRTLYTSHPPAPDPVSNQDDEHHLLVRMERAAGQKKYGHRVAMRPDQPALTQIGEHRQVRKAHKDLARHVADNLGSMRFLDPSPSQMREPAFPGQRVLGDSGENLPTVLQAICDDPQRRETLLEWTRELTPMDVADFEFPKDPTSGRVQLFIREQNGGKVSGHSASDGTLRFLGMLAALLGTNRPDLYVFEEMDKGIHPSRQHLLVELIESQTAGGDIQVVTTTLSPDLLARVGDDTFKHTSVVCRNPDAADAIIRPVAELPNAEKLRRSQGLRTLHATGWMEDILYFSQNGDQEQSS